MKVSFEKYQATGNDFVMIDNRDGRYDTLEREAIQHLCDRRFGVGGDGLIMLNNSKKYDFEMHYFNADGAPGSMCGNGGRCILAFASKKGIMGDELHFLAYDGAHSGRFEDGLVSLKMNPVTRVHDNGDDKVLDTGSPHYVRFVHSLNHLDVYNEGRSIRNSDTFKAKGINVNFVERVGNDEIYVRTYERGVEDETYSCGTGVTAASIAAGGLADGNKQFKIRTRGGNLKVSYTKKGDRYEDIWLTGPATFVFDGEIEI